MVNYARSLAPPPSPPQPHRPFPPGCGVGVQGGGLDGLGCAVQRRWGGSKICVPGVRVGGHARVRLSLADVHADGGSSASAVVVESAAGSYERGAGTEEEVLVRAGEELVSEEEAAPPAVFEGAEGSAGRGRVSAAVFVFKRKALTDAAAMRRCITTWMSSTVRKPLEAARGRTRYPAEGSGSECRSDADGVQQSHHLIFAWAAGQPVSGWGMPFF